MVHVFEYLAFVYLNLRSPVGETVWEGLGCAVLLEEVCH